MWKKKEKPVKKIIKTVVKEAPPVPGKLEEKPKPRTVQPTPPKRKRGRPAKFAAVPPTIKPEAPGQEMKTEPAKSEHKTDANTKREAVTVAIIGTTGSGKSTKALTEAKKLGKNILIITNNFEPHIWRQFPEKEINPENMKAADFIRVVRIADKGEKESFEIIRDHFRNGVIIFDDCKQYISNNYEQNRALKEIVINHRHHATDLFFIAHSPEEIPPRLWGFVKFAFVGVCTTEIKKANFRAQEKDKFFAAVEAARQEMKKRAAQGIEKPHAGLFICVLLSHI